MELSLTKPFPETVRLSSRIRLFQYTPVHELRSLTRSHRDGLSVVCLSG